MPQNYFSELQRQTMQGRTRAQKVASRGYESNPITPRSVIYQEAAKFGPGGGPDRVEVVPLKNSNKMNSNLVLGNQLSKRKAGDRPGTKPNTQLGRQRAGTLPTTASEMRSTAQKLQELEEILQQDKQQVASLGRRT